MKTINFPADIPSTLNDSFENRHILAFDSTSIQDAVKNCHYPELVREPLGLALYLTFLHARVTDLIVLDNERIQLQMTIWGCWKEDLNWLSFPSSKKSTVSLYSNIGTLVSSFLITLQFFKWRLCHFQIRNSAIRKVNKR